MPCDTNCPWLAADRHRPRFGRVPPRFAEQRTGERVVPAAPEALQRFCGAKRVQAFRGVTLIFFVERRGRGMSDAFQKLRVGIDGFRVGR